MKVFSLSVIAIFAYDHDFRNILITERYSISTSAVYLNHLPDNVYYDAH